MNSYTHRKLGIVYAVDCETGEEFEIGEFVNLDISELDDATYSYPHFVNDELVISFNISIQPKIKLMLYGLTNNYIRMHGGKPLRKVKARFL